MDSNNLSILVEAKKEYLNQLFSIMCPFMIETFQEIYNEAQKMSKGKKVLLQFQRLLKEDVPNWNNHIITQHVNKLTSSCSWFNDLLAAIFVSVVKILSAVRLKAEQKKIAIKLPSNDLFVQTCYVNTARELYKDPYIFQDALSEFERDEKLIERFSRVIKQSIEELVPIQEILKSCMSTNDSETTVGDNLEVESDMHPEDTPDPEVLDEEFDVPQAQPEPTEEPTTSEAQIEGEGGDDESKVIPMNQPQQTTANEGGDGDDGVLFPDAIEQKQNPN